MDNGRTLQFCRVEDKVTCVLLGMCFPFSILLLPFFYLAILLEYRTLGDNVLGGGGMWWGKLGHHLVSWHFPVYIEPSALLLLIITTYRNTFLSFLLTDCFPTDWLRLTTDRPTDRQTDRLTALWFPIWEWSYPPTIVPIVERSLVYTSLNVSIGLYSAKLHLGIL
jgi:hypothetical protein